MKTSGNRVTLDIHAQSRDSMDKGNVDLEAKVYNFGKTTFSNNIWIKGGGTFYNPLSVHLNPKGKINVTIQVYTSNNTLAGTMSTGNFSGSVNFPIGHLTGNGMYKIRLVNGKQNTVVELTRGQVYYS